MDNVSLVMKYFHTSLLLYFYICCHDAFTCDKWKEVEGVTIWDVKYEFVVTMPLGTPSNTALWVRRCTWRTTIATCNVIYRENPARNTLPENIHHTVTKDKQQCQSWELYWMLFFAAVRNIQDKYVWDRIQGLILWFDLCLHLWAATSSHSLFKLETHIS